MRGMDGKSGLVVSRKEGEVVRIGMDITVTVCRMRGKQVKLHISAPRDMAVTRGELGIEAHADIARTRAGA